MDLKKFGSFIILFGVLIAAVGGAQYLTNSPVQAKKAEGSGLMASINAMGEALEAMSENVERKQKRESATDFLLGGAAVAVIGVALRASARRDPPSA